MMSRDSQARDHPVCAAEPTMAQSGDPVQRGTPARAATGSLLPLGMREIAAGLHQRQMSDAVLLLLASHRPLTFFAGQLLYTLAPALVLVGWEEANTWAALLSAADANRRLTALLTPPREMRGSAHINHETL